MSYYQYDSYDAGETLSAQKGMKIIKRLQKVIEIQFESLSPRYINWRNPRKNRV